ncbi:putative GntR family transcriptional regulator [Gordonia polyisoprenivorans NBRC 16320 = JCM 10675]|uniref:FadR family transcriptional regulator n=1 Tax=Gordonia polyisoprenivorans TaxID=84595 RepID=A0A846WRZ8_9ACTN|nr:FadR/GntR family transcriptional regulator [Gordonia polyisoprenivorans]NKY04458.1 FadR family transcriptional regulator [Gordonia polyisoprenivorans]OZC29492.1 FadR family transcriptional regulator [Gordonia polyisoprenivorans]GAB25483.1 putative GntR family transcriptional regulator [Gordonia polyisoprenivorans NBRC 16320 = JCM 10675]
MSEQKATVIGAIEVPRPADVYADLIRGKILDGELPIGTQLPTERQLVEESGLARSVVRESLQQLQRQGLINTKPGRHGGSVVSRPTADAVMESVDLHLQGWAPNNHALVQSRQVMEPWIAYFAAEQRTDEQAAELQLIDEKTAEAITGLHDFVACKAQWHSTLAQASHNEVLSTLMGAVARSIFRQVEVITLQGDRESMEQSLAEHRAVTDAVVNHRPAAAYRLMSGHLRTPPVFDPLHEGAGEPMGEV